MNWKKEMEEDRKIRKEHADYEFIKKQPLRLRKGLEAYIETGDLYFASRVAGLKLEEMNELRIKANIFAVT